MSAALAAVAKPEAPDWKPNRELIADELRNVNAIHEGKPTCRLCGQVVNRLDAFGLCSKVTAAHKEWRGDAVPGKARKR
ncbi:hypothetical protein [Microbacterium foliorum]|uniref:hypothetical protein n=1 Tax=Microbacterium foliorum TaxID=104336 RepID=UPI0009A030D4|nr:hypothetical protein [Microbacterium foliorum]AQY02058.1 hypothetical protein B2G67_11685 [Microbacterium foliorum]